MRLASPKQEAAAWSLSRDINQSAAAREANVNRATVGRWLNDPAFSARVDELRIKALAPHSEDDPAGEAQRGLARLVPIAEAVIEAALSGEEHNGRMVTPQQHNYALKTIELARKLEPMATGNSETPSLGALIAQADEARSARD